MMPRGESDMMRTLRQLDYDAHQLRGVDLLALAIGYGLLLAIVAGLAVSLLDWLAGRPHEVLPAIVSLLEALDGAPR